MSKPLSGSMGLVSNKESVFNKGSSSQGLQAFGICLKKWKEVLKKNVKMLVVQAVLFSLEV